MASFLQADGVCPTCNNIRHDTQLESDIASTQSIASSAQSVRVGCCACIRRRRQSSKPRRIRLRKNHKNTKIRCLRAYLYYIWIDSLLLSLFGILILGLHFAPNNRHDLPLMPFWTPVPPGSDFTDEDWDFRAPTEFLFPYRKSPLSDFVCALLVTMVPVVVIGLFQLKIRSVWDFNAGQVGILKAVTTTTLIVLFLKLYVGAFRPNFLDICKPNRTLLHEEVVRHKLYHTAMFFNATICTGERELVKNSLQSFPSGHAANSFAAAIFLALYINAKLKTLGDHASQYWAFLLTIAPLILASILAALMFITHQHHMRDLYAGMVLGLVTGSVCYRSAYAAVFDSRYNHIPLPPFAAKTRISFLKNPKKCCTEICDEIGDEELDELVVWNWWKLGPNEQNATKEEFWLRNIRSTRATGCEIGFDTGSDPLPTQDNSIPLHLTQVTPRGESTQASQNSTRALGTQCANSSLQTEITRCVNPNCRAGKARLQPLEKCQL